MYSHLNLTKALSLQSRLSLKFAALWWSKCHHILAKFTRLFFQGVRGKYPQHNIRKLFLDIKCFAKSTELVLVCDNSLEVSFANDFTCFTVFGCIFSTSSAIIVSQLFLSSKFLGNLVLWPVQNNFLCN